MQVQENVNLKEYTTFKLSATASYFVTCTSKEEVREAVLFAKEKKLPIFFLGGGSNTIFTDSGFSGVVIHIANKGISVLEENSIEVTVEVKAGGDWDAFVFYAVGKGWYGLENLSLIPGTVGGAPVQNIGAYGVEIGTFIKEVCAFDTEKMEEITLSQEACAFTYRSSIFKEFPGRYVILSITLTLPKTFSPVLTYEGITQTLLGKEITAENLRDAVISVRQRKLPNWHELPTAGSFFKNPEVEDVDANLLREKLPELPIYPYKGHSKVSAGFLIEHVAHMKGEKRGGVGVYDKHALVLVNYGEGTYSELEALIKEIVEKVKVGSGITLEPEVNIIL